MDPSERPMTKEYARLSAHFGLICGQIDTYLGGNVFQTKMRENAWTLTPELLDAFKQEARDLAVPEPYLVVDDQIIETLLPYAQRAQTKRDRARRRARASPP